MLFMIGVLPKALPFINTEEDLPEALREAFRIFNKGSNLLQALELFE
jgi:hypothetical protein